MLYNERRQNQNVKKRGKMKKGKKRLKLFGKSIMRKTAS